MQLMMTDRNLRKFQDTVIELVVFAKDNGGINMEAVPLEDANKFTCLFLEATRRDLTRRELQKMVDLIQRIVELPMYTTPQAAAWWGLTQDGVSHILWPKQRGRVPPTPLVESYKYGHTRLIPHEEMVRYQRVREGKDD